MIGYFEELKAYRLFDTVKRQIIIRRNVQFTQKYYSIKLLNDSSGLLHDDPFDVVFDTGALIPCFNPLT